MTILVVGRGGQLAQSLAEAARSSQIDLIALGRPELDLTDAALIEAALAQPRPALVINAAAYTAVDKAEADEPAARAVNALAAGTLAAVCERSAIPLVHISTDYVFDGLKPAAYVEDDATGPINAYGRTKREGERLVASNCARHLIVRTAWVFSPYGHNFAKTMLRLAESRPELSVVDDQIGCPTYAPHLADALLSLCSPLLAPQAERSRGQSWGIYHAAGSGETTWCGFAREIFRCSGQMGGPAAVVKPITTADYPTPAQRPANSRLDSGKLARTFGVELPDWRAGTQACVARLLASWRQERVPTGSEA